LHPVKDLINGHNLIVIPEGILSFLPFETFIKKMPDSLTSGYYKDLSYLLYDYNISYSYSSTLYAESRKKTSKKRIKKLLAFAPKYDSSNVVLTKNQQLFTRQKKYRKELFPIPGVVEEVNSIKNLIRSDVFLSKDATETNFRNVAEFYDILHLAMHTFIDNENPMYSKLIFTLGEDTLNDGFLNTFEIFSLKLKARMVVLSACSTGEGNFSKGEGVMSLARSFAYAGAPSMLLTLWQVEDKSGVKLMLDFYSGIKKGMSKPEALRYAKMKYIKEAKPENSHPFFWSTYISMGNPASLFRKINFLTTVLLISGISLILLTGLYYFRKKTKTKTS
jgi:CHAT domain-containing protein